MFIHFWIKFYLFYIKLWFIWYKPYCLCCRQIFESIDFLNFPPFFIIKRKQWILLYVIQIPKNDLLFRRLKYYGGVLVGYVTKTPIKDTEVESSTIYRTIICSLPAVAQWLSAVLTAKGHECPCARKSPQSRTTHSNKLTRMCRQSFSIHHSTHMVGYHYRKFPTRLANYFIIIKYLPDKIIV